MKTNAAGNETILEAAVALGVPSMTAEEAGQQILTLLQQVGDLECANGLQKVAIEVLKEENRELKSRNAALEDAIRAIPAKCIWRTIRMCAIDCLGRAYCNVEGLTPVCLQYHTGEVERIFS